MASPATPSVAPPPRPAAPSPTEDAFQQAIVELFGPAADVLGIPRSIAAIYAVIFASPRPLCFADVENRLGLSKGSVSQGLRVLRNVGAIQIAGATEQSAKREEPSGVSEAPSGKSKEPTAQQPTLAVPLALGANPHSPAARTAAAGANGAPRRDHYVPDMELRQLVARLLKDRIEPQLAGSSKRLASLVESVPFADPEEADLVRGRLRHLQSWQRKARQIVPFAKTVLKLGVP